MASRILTTAAFLATACQVGTPSIDRPAPHAIRIPTSEGVSEEPADPPVAESDVPVLIAAPVEKGQDPLVRDFVRARGAILAVRLDGTLQRIGKQDSETIDRDVIPGLSVAADGRRFAYARQSSGYATDLFVASLDARGASIAITDWPGTEDMPALSPDAARIAFVSARSGVASIWVAPVRARGGDVAVQVTNVGVVRPTTPGKPPADFVPPPDFGSLKWDGDSLVWRAGSQTLRVEVPR